jgi:DNA-binding response OmpR family regulator
MKRILIVEDDNSTRRQLAQLFRFENFDVCEAPDGRAGVELAMTATPDLVVCDIMMPVLDGFGVLQALREHPATALVPFIFLTAKVESKDLRFGMNQGADDYITKPFDPDVLLASVRQRLSRRERQLGEARRQAEEVSLAAASTIPREILGCLEHIESVTSLLTLKTDGVEPQAAEMRRAVQQELERLRRMVRRLNLYAQLPQLYARRFEQASAEGESQADLVISREARAIAKEWARPQDLRFSAAPTTLPMKEEFLAVMTQELVGNAFKFSPPGTPVSVAGIPEDGCWVLVVSDSGPGMTPGQVSQVGAFRQFWNGEGRPCGLGLGLALVQGLARLHGGEVVIEGTGGGTRVSLMLPEA